MPGRRDRGDAGCDLLAPIILRHLGLDAGVDLLHIGKIILHHLIGLGLGGFLIAHPEFPVLCRDHDLGVRKRHRAIGGTNAVGVIGMQMRHQDDVDALGVDASCSEILQGAAGSAFARLQHGNAVAAVDQDQLGAGVDELRVERHRDHAFRHITGLSLSLRLFLRNITNEVIDRPQKYPVVDRSAFVIADLVAIEAGRLCACRRHGGAHG